MVVPIPKMKKDLARALEIDDLERIKAIRRALTKQHPDSDEAAEAHYRLGMHALFKDGDVDEAVLRFRSSAKCKHPEWSPLARISLGLLLHRQGKSKQAVFELRKAASAKPPSLTQAQALGFMVMVLRESQDGAQAERVRDEQLSLLERLTRVQDPEEKAHAHYLLGMEKKFDGYRAEAAEHLQAALQSGGLPEADQARIQEILSDL